LRNSKALRLVKAGRVKCVSVVVISVLRASLCRRVGKGLLGWQTLRQIPMLKVRRAAIEIPNSLPAADQTPPARHSQTSETRPTVESMEA